MLVFRAFSALLSYPSRGDAAGAAGDSRCHSRRTDCGTPRTRKIFSI